MPVLKWFAFAALVFSTGIATAQKTPPFRVVGYLPEYRLPDYEAARAAPLTDLIFFSVLPAADGAFESPVLDKPATVQLLNAVRKQGVRVHLCVGGWDRSQKFPEVAATEESRRTFAKGALDYCRTHDFAGIDLDWEHPTDEAQQEHYGLLLEELARVFHAEQKEVSLAMAGWQHLSARAFAAVDGVNLMSYDGPERHATFDQAVREVAGLRKENVPAAKIRLGLPFYGRGITNRDQVSTYAQIVQMHRLKANVNEIDGLFFNGPDLIKQKVAWAQKQKLGGVMVWEIGQDAAGDKSLLKVIRKSVR